MNLSPRPTKKFLFCVTINLEIWSIFMKKLSYNFSR